MPFLLHTIRKIKWSYDPDIRWLQLGELQADALVDIKTTDNALSMWFIEDDRSNLERVIAALAANQDYPANIDYALINLSDIAGNGFKLEKTKGETADIQVNSWHHDIVELSAGRLLQLAQVFQSAAEKQRVPKPDVHQFLLRGINQKHLDPQRIKIKSEKTRKDLGLPIDNP
jgi:hypothetical protein